MRARRLKALCCHWIGRIYELVASKRETLKGALAIMLNKSDMIDPAADAIRTEARGAATALAQAR